MEERQDQNLELLHGVNGFRESQLDMADVQPEDSSERDQRLADLLKENAELKRTVETLNMELRSRRGRLTESDVQTIDGRKEREEELKRLVQSLENAELNFNKERAEWRKLQQELEDRATVSESKVIALEKGHDGLEETVARLKEELNQKDKASTTETLDDSCSGQRAQELSRKVEEQQGNRVRLEAEGKGLERRAVKAEKKLRNDANPVQEKQDMVLEMKKQMSDLQKDHEALNTTVGGLKEQQLEQNKMSRVTGALASELRLQRQQHLTLREWEKDLIQQQEGLEQEKDQWVKTVRELSEQSKRINAMFEDERKKTARLEKNAEQTAEKTERMKRAFQRKVTCFQQRDEEANDLMTELRETKEQLENNAEETALKTERMKRAFQRKVNRFQQREEEANNIMRELRETKEQLEKNAEEMALKIERMKQSFQRAVNRFQQREEEANNTITELQETKEQLEKNAEETALKIERMTQAFHREVKRLDQKEEEHLDNIINLLKTKEALENKMLTTEQIKQALKEEVKSSQQKLKETLCIINNLVKDLYRLEAELAAVRKGKAKNKSTLRNFSLKKCRQFITSTRLFRMFC